VIAYPKSPFHEDTLKDLLRDALKDFKTGNCNEKGTEKVVLQFDGVLTQLKALDDHSTRNVLKLKQDFINGRLGTIGVGPSFPSSIKANCPSPTLRPNNPPSSNIGPFKGQWLNKKCCNSNPGILQPWHLASKWVQRSMMHCWLRRWTSTTTKTRWRSQTWK
jgi:hypothetical protein